MSAHTPGPWRIERGGGHANPSIRGSDVIHTNGRERDASGISSASYSDLVCEIPHYLGLPGPMANARLIAAAPELLELLRRGVAVAAQMRAALQAGESLTSSEWAAVDREARALLAKIDGGANG